MTSGIRFESEILLEDRRQDLRNAREEVLDKAKSKYEKEENERKKARLRGEDKWLLPSVDSRIAKESKDILSKKKKIKKEKKKKKKKKKSKSSSDNSDEEEWVETAASSAVEETHDISSKPVIKGPTMPQRESWMEAPLDFLHVTSRQEIRDKKQAEKDIEREKESVIEQMGRHSLELNPYWKDGGTGMPDEKNEKEKPAPRIGDGGAEWLKKSYVRCKEQARQEGRSFEELATERWGSVEKMEKMIADAEKTLQPSTSNYRPDRGSDRRSKFQRPSSPNRDDHNTETYISRKEKDRPRFQRPSSPDGYRNRSRDSDKDTYRDNNRDKSRERNREYKKDSYRDKQRYQRTLSPVEDSGTKSRHGRFKRPTLPDSGNEHSSSISYKQSSCNRNNSRRSHSRSPSRSSDRHREGRRDDHHSSHSGKDVPRWKKKTVEENESEKTNTKTEQLSSDLEINKSRKRHKSSSSSSSSSASEDSSSSSSELENEEDSEDEQPTPLVILTEAEMNALAAKILKAEIMGDEKLALNLKTQLEEAREVRENAPPPPPPKAAADEKVVLLTRTTKSGLVLPLAEAKCPKEAARGRKRQKKVATHEDGQRQRYFDDDDTLDLKTMVQREKMGTAEDQNSMFARLAGRSVEKTDDDYQVDDIFISKAARQQSESKIEEKDKMKAIMEHQKMSAAVGKCQFCFDKVPKHLIIAIGRKSYLCLPQHKPLTTGHCLIVPMNHCPSATTMDEDVWQEMQNFRKTLANMFSERGEDCIFMETSMFLKWHPHTYIECVPLEREVGDLAPIYFKKAIQDSESEWSQNKKLVDLSKKDIKHAVPKGFPYFCVDFGLQGGFAHVIEDERLFPTYFGREIVGGMVDANHRLWKNPPKENFDEQRLRVLEFDGWWKPHDWTHNV